MFGCFSSFSIRSSGNGFTYDRISFTKIVSYISIPDGGIKRTFKKQPYVLPCIRRKECQRLVERIQDFDIAIQLGQEFLLNDTETIRLFPML